MSWQTEGEGFGKYTKWVEPTVRAPEYDIMIDIETLGVEPGSVILNIGAVEFDPKTGQFGKELYVRINIADSQKHGMTISGDTISWWMNKTSTEARLQSFGPGQTSGLTNALWQLYQFANGKKVWSHGPAMDVVLIEYACRAVEVKIPWSYGAVRCTRTIYDLAGVSADHSKGTHHNALDDAKAQAAAVIEGYKRLSLDIAA